ncbi:hypothetical protein RYZ49_13000 [Klebsiella pasteurii]|uniref:Uncharacterized protein n=1 Tax=Klebsiella pasteurii TaxID=2587529 RepID=A0ABD5HH08_9ENTR|nr:MULTISPECIES: hypothetical protein [Klebsiella]DAR37531.1 MAG TPA: hypothetical protein [Caudoviricetes sp.]HED3886801.1 hypothetical protein [Klebsiella pneumoniae]MBA8015971.1 hypothetical protein [Klebsiella oxytoca]MDW2716723.1 hypothetical protein [Klebsiella pasteurii]HBG9534975.1 hypothetical protein [Klebsiella oxytoca]
MDFRTKHDGSESATGFWLQIFEDLGEDKGVNMANLEIWVDRFIDSRAELNAEIKKNALEFLKRAVISLEAELKDN